MSPWRNGGHFSGYFSNLEFTANCRSAVATLSFIFYTLVCYRSIAISDVSSVEAHSLTAMFLKKKSSKIKSPNTSAYFRKAFPREFTTQSAYTDRIGFRADFRVEPNVVL